MPQNSSTYIIGDVRDCLAAIPDGSIDLVMTSPPFLALRSYLPADHPDKHREIGAEPDPATFLDTLLLLTAEFGRVLAPHGSICVELGDTYSGSGGAGGYYNPDVLRDGQSKFDGVNHRRGKVVDHDSGRRNPGPGWPLPKSLCGIPHLYHLSLAYGRNLLTGEESPAGRWRVRNVVAWCRPNPPVGALGDKFRPATSYMTIACREGSRFFDLDAVRTAHKHPDDAARARTGHRDAGKVGGDGASNPNGAPPLDYWVIPTQPYSGSHYAVYPPALCERPIKSMAPAKVCTVCGEPSRRITERSPDYAAAREQIGRFNNRGHGDGVSGSRSVLTKAAGRDIACAENVTTGWSECECPDDGAKWRPGVVLDPFAGSGTTLMVANELERDAIGFDLDERNASLARDRVDKFLFSDFRALPLDEFMEGAVLLAPQPNL
jgi:DNA modification methylase